jgi:hypothetical protein
MSTPILLDDKLAEELRAFAATEEVAPLVNEAVRRYLQAMRIRKLLKEMDEESGPIPKDIRRQAREFPWPD